MIFRTWGGRLWLILALSIAAGVTINLALMYHNSVLFVLFLAVIAVTLHVARITYNEKRIDLAQQLHNQKVYSPSEIAEMAARGITQCDDHFTIGDKTSCVVR